MKHFKLFFALFAMLALGVGNAWGAEWEKVTSAPADWSGEYLLVYESGTTAYVWTGVDAASCNTQGTISSNKITGDFVSLTIATMTGGYSIKVNGGTNNGKYIYGTSGSNKINFGTTAKANTLTYESNSTKIESNTSVMRYNPQTGNLRFRYFKSSSYSSQKAVQLYKKVEQSEGGAVTEDLGDALKWSAATATVQVGADDNVFPTLTNDKNVAVAYTSSSTDVATIDANGEVTLVKEGTTTISAYYEGGEIEGVTYSAKNVSYTLTVKPAPLVIEPIEGGIIDILTHKTLAATSSSYANFTGKQAANENHSDAVYAGRSARNGNATQYSIQLNTIDKGRIATTTSGGIAKRVYVKWSTQATLNTNARALNIYGSNDAFTGSETAAPSTKIGTITFTTGAAEAYVDLEGDYKHILITGSGAIYMDEIQVTWVVAEGTVTTPTISGADEFIESTEVTISAEDGLKVYYTLDGTDPTNASTEYTAPFELTATTTVKAVAYDGEKASDIVSKTFKKLQVLTCEEAADACKSTESADKYVIRGYVTNVKYAYNEEYKTATFWIADTKDGGQVLQAYSAKPVAEIDKAVKVGDYVEAIGNLKLYNETPEITNGTYTIIPAPVVNHTITVSANPAEAGTVTGAGEYEEGTEVSLTATPAAHYVFVNWTNGEDVVSTENPYTFAVTADVTLVANFALDTHTVAVTAENGTVAGAGSFTHGTEVSLTATPADGYQFVNWTNGEEEVSTDNPYTFVVAEDVALVANFELIPVVEPEKPEPTYTENNLNPYAFGLESKLSADKETLTVTYRLNNSNATSVNVVVYNGEEVVATVAGTTTIGKNTVEVATADLPGGVELTWAVIVNGTSVEAPTLEEKIYSFFHPSSVDIDNNPENPTFGMLLVNEAMQSVASETEGYVSAGFGAGIFAFTPSFDLIPNGELPGYNGGKTFSTVKNDFAPRRIRISEDGRIFATAQDGSGEYLWEINPENLNDWTTVFQGTNEGYSLKDAEGNFIAGTNSGFDVRGEGENLQLLMLSSSLPGAQVGSFKCHTYDLGTATTWATAPTKEIPGANYMLVTNQSNAQFDKDGGVWYISYRGTTTEKEPGLVHINKDGVEDYKELRNMTRNAGFRFNHDFTKVIIAGNNGASKKATIYAISEDANGAPVLTQETVIDMSAVGANLNDFAWDYAGNLYACGNSSEKLAAWAMPYSGEVETPAASKYAFQLEGQLAETWDVTMTNLQVDDYGESIGLSADDKNTGLNVWLAIDTNGVIIPDYSSAAIVQGWSEIELPIVAGNLTKTYVDSLDTDVYSGLVIAEYEGGYLGLNLTMYYVPVPPVVVIVENATVDDQTENTGIMYMRGQWTDAESVVYPVTVEVPGFDATLAETVYDNVTVTVGGMEDEPWLGFGQGSATVTIANNLVTLKSVVSDWGGTVIDITISGNLPQGPGTALDNVDVEAKTIKMLKNGQLIIIKNGVQYNVQGQVIK